MWIKICGIRDEATARQVAELQPDAIGLNFYAKSVRCVSRALAARIASELPVATQAVGLFVNASTAEVAETVVECGLTMIQLHGDERPNFLAEVQEQLPQIPLLRAWRVGDNLVDLADYLRECRQLNVRLFGCLMDAKVAGVYGGSGQSPPWDVLRHGYLDGLWPPLILAGGLTPQNVADGIQTVQPWGVDVASGVESSPGVKDLARIKDFIRQARSA